MSDIVQPQSNRDPQRFRGHNSSEEANRFQDNVVADIHSLSAAVNAVHSRLVSFAGDRDAEVAFLKREVADLKSTIDYREHTFGKAGLRIDREIDFHNTSGFIVPFNLSAKKVATFNSRFGEIYLPANAIENKFYNLSLRTTEIVLPSDLVVETTNLFDKSDGEGIQDYEKGGKLSETDPQNAFNGINEKSWIRSVEFPLESNIDEVEAQLDVIVPAGASDRGNLIELIPFPEGSIDVTLLATSPDLGSSFTMVDNFKETNNMIAKRYHFTPRNIAQIRIRIRCRNWREINGKKVFTYGLQELGAKHIDYVKEFVDGDAFGDNVTHIVKIDPPTNHRFNKIFRIDPKPFFIDEDINSRHVRLRLSTTPDFSGVFWDSNIHTPPQTSVTSGISTGSALAVYALYTLKYVSSTASTLSSVFSAGTTSYQKSLGLVFSATPTNANQ